MQEIERKFLIRFPDRDMLLAHRNATSSRITQTYLLSDSHGASRVRRRAYADRVEYTHTVKKRLSNLTAMETENLITEEMYLALLEKADPSRSPIEKERITFPYENHLMEIDIYPFWRTQAVLEIELESEEESVRIPNEVVVIREVTDDPKYKNRAMALSIPSEDTLL